MKLIDIANKVIYEQKFANLFDAKEGKIFIDGIKYTLKASVSRFLPKITIHVEKIHPVEDSVGDYVITYKHPTEGIKTDPVKKDSIAFILKKVKENESEIKLPPLKNKSADLYLIKAE
jgi:hypothetical protein